MTFGGIIRGVPEDLPSQLIGSSAWWKLVEHGTWAFIGVTSVFFCLAFVWSLRGKLGGVLLAWKNQSEVMTSELPRIREGVQKLADEATGTLKRVEAGVDEVKAEVRVLARKG